MGSSGLSLAMQAGAVGRTPAEHTGSHTSSPGPRRGSAQGVDCEKGAFVRKPGFSSQVSRGPGAGWEPRKSRISPNSLWTSRPARHPHPGLAGQGAGGRGRLQLGSGESQSGHGD